MPLLNCGGIFFCNKLFKLFAVDNFIILKFALKLNYYIC